MWGGGAQCVHASLPRAARQPAPTLSGAIASRRPPRPLPPSPTLVAQIDSSVACLWLLTPLSAGTAVVAVLVAVTTNNWLHTEENMLNPSYNGTGRHSLVAKHTVSGLWRLCHTDPGSSVFRCVDIPYFPLSRYAPDPIDSTNAIPLTRSAAPLLLAVLTQAFGALCCVLGHCVKGRRLCTFIAGVLFIISGLIMLTGIVMYISVFKSQVNHKLHYMTFFATPRMSYSYGYSFGLYISGFIAVELAGTSAIFLFLQWYQKDWITELTEKAKADGRAWDREYAFSDFRERDSSLLERRMMKRDTYPPSGSSAATPRERRRFVFDGDDMPHCSIHKNRRINLSSASLKDLSTSTLYGFPAAPRPTACDNYFEEFKEVPQSANTLSGLRSASIFQSQTSVASGRFLDTSAVEPPPSREEELVTFGAGARVCAGDAAEPAPRHDRAVGTDPYRRTTPENVILMFVGGWLHLVLNNCGMDKRLVSYFLCAGGDKAYSAKKIGATELEYPDLFNYLQYSAYAVPTAIIIVVEKKPMSNYSMGAVKTALAKSRSSLAKNDLPPAKMESGILFWKYIDKNTDYSYFLLMGGSVALYMASVQTALGLKIASNIGDSITGMGWDVGILIVILGAAFLGTIMSGTGAQAVYMPLIINMYGVPSTIICAVVLWVTLCFYAPILWDPDDYGIIAVVSPNAKVAVEGGGAAETTTAAAPAPPPEE
ncbi:hypothetical protein MSG28_004077 [Choristoneura fumiferana]|uniref:Uncharacterized protein n=1 Tax=Choristoneura fumiferana TaxID=7141 RepID=A0ACC0KHH5_CHOFU|nr:hypothetical protein MSG28_004077 [Choristoneura fumiferana]